MAEYTVTGIRHNLFKECAKEERDAKTEAFLKQLEANTPVILVAEPDNPKDEKAIAVYLDFTRHFGYIACEQCEELIPLLDEWGQLDARITGTDGHLTAFIDVPGAPESACPPPRTNPILPECPLPRGIMPAFSDEEKALQVLATHLTRLEVSKENVDAFLALVEKYMPLSKCSLSREDDLWRDRIFRLLRKAGKLELTDEQRQLLRRLKGRLSTTIGDLRRTCGDQRVRMFDEQLERLRTEAGCEGGIFGKFEQYVRKTGEEKSQLIERLRAWLRNIHCTCPCDFRDHRKLVETLNYRGASRRELYDVFGAILLLERYGELLAEVPTRDELLCRLTPIFFGYEKEARDFLESIQGMKPRNITDKVRQLVAEGKISPLSKGRELWSVLHDGGLYGPTESNWNMQVSK